MSFSMVPKREFLNVPLPVSPCLRPHKCLAPTYAWINKLPYHGVGDIPNIAIKGRLSNGDCVRIELFAELNLYDELTVKTEPMNAKK